MAKDVETTTALDRHIPPGWQKGPDLDPVLRISFTVQFVCIVPKQDNSRDADFAKTTLELEKAEIGDEVITVLLWDDTYPNSLRKGTIRIADLFKHRRQLLEEQASAVKHDKKILSDAISSALIAT